MKTSLGRALACAGALLTLTAATAATVAPATSAPAARTSTPSVGTCYAMRANQESLMSNHATKVSCAKKHTARAFAVFAVPAGTDMGDHSALEALVLKKCEPAFAKSVGSTPAHRYLTVYHWIWFQPTQQQVDAGDRTLECDLALYGGKTTIAPLPTDATPALKGHPPYADSVRKCVDSKGYYVPCSMKHVLRSTTDFTMPGSKKYPSQKAFDRADRQHCGAHGYAFNPTMEQWTQGFRLVLCAQKTRK